MDTQTPVLSPNAGEAFFINQECSQDRPSSGKVSLCPTEVELMAAPASHYIKETETFCRKRPNLVG